MLSLVQQGDPAVPPLLLIHDGGGTTCSYHHLSGINCDVYAIENPLLQSGGAWRDGIKTMALAYSAAARAGIKSRDIVLGGWSFGGLVALEMVAVMTVKYGFDIVGVLLLDSVYPGSWRANRSSLGDADLSTFSPGLKRLDMQILILDMMKQSVEMASKWQAPAWESVPNSDSESDAGLECLCCAFERSNAEPCVHSERRGPPVVLLRCSERVKGDNTARVDASRDCESLGWNHFRPGLVTKTLELDANHFSIFTPGHIEQTIAKSSEALELIYRLRLDRL